MFVGMLPGPGCPYVHLLSVRDVISMYGETWVEIAEKVFKVKGQGHDRTECYNGVIHFDGVAHLLWRYVS